MSLSKPRIPNIIRVSVHIYGPRDNKTLYMALDTGASYTMIPFKKAMDIGYDPAVTMNKIQIFTASGIEYVPVIKIASFKSMGIEVKNLEIICHDLPPQSTIDGLLGLNFLIHYPPFIEFYKCLRKHN